MRVKSARKQDGPEHDKLQEDMRKLQESPKPKGAGVGGVGGSELLGSIGPPIGTRDVGPVGFVVQSP